MMDTLELLVPAREHAVGGVDVRRVLPYVKRRNVGPFVFVDHMAPTTFPAGQGVDVPPHPHIGLATLTYLFEGRFLHRDGLGTVQRIEPGEVNWMVAGRGLAHSERTLAEDRAAPQRVHGIQTWVALPRSHEEMAPAFHHYARESLRSGELDRVRLRVIAGSAYGERSPVATLSELFYVEAHVPRGAALPMPREHEERAVYVVSGELRAGDQRIAAGTLATFRPRVEALVHAEQDTHALLLGGEPLDGPRHIWWNFVASTRERIEEAKRDWAQQRLAPIPGETEFVPLPGQAA